MSSLTPPLQELLEEGDELWLEKNGDRYELELDHVVYLPPEGYRFEMKDSSADTNPFKYDQGMHSNLSAGYQGTETDLLSLEEDYLEKLCEAEDPVEKIQEDIEEAYADQI